jgi:murein L,D-transpeptidase YafK
LGARHGALEHRQLLTECQILERDRSVSATVSARDRSTTTSAASISYPARNQPQHQPGPAISFWRMTAFDFPYGSAFLFYSDDLESPSHFVPGPKECMNPQTTNRRTAKFEPSDSRNNLNNPQPLKLNH